MMVQITEKHRNLKQIKSKEFTMRHLTRRLIILSAIFLMAVGVYFIWNQKRAEPDVLYTAIEDANLPVVYTEMYGEEVNGLHGYLKEDSQAAAREALTVLPADRRLNITIRGGQAAVTGLEYQIRSLDRERLLEKTAVTQWDSAGDGSVAAQLPIENLLAKDEEYLLTLRVDMEQRPSVYYTTRILWTDSAYAQQMIALAREFSGKTFDYGQATSLTTYLESDPAADNSSLGEVTLKSSFSQLVWNNLDVTPVGEVSVTLKDLQGIMGNVQLDYLASRQPEDGPQELYEISENFTMRWTAQRIYMMDYDRRMNQIFQGDESLFSGKRIILGISDGEGLSAMADASENYQAFVTGRELWCLDRQENRAVRIFAFRDDENSSGQNNYDSHGIKILSVSENGDVNFLVYGYMNRGNHEGTSGIAMYRYSAPADSIVEKFYIPADEPFELLQNDLNTLSYLNSEDVACLYIGGSVYSLDLAGGEYTVIASGLTDGRLAVSDDQSRLAWQEPDSSFIQLLDLKTGRNDEIRGENGSQLEVLGFVGSDFVYGLAQPGAEIMENGRATGTAMYALEVISDAMEVETRYEKPGLFISGVEISDSRIHMKRFSKNGDSYAAVDEDTLVCNENLSDETAVEIGWYAAQDRKRVYFVQLDRELAAGASIRLASPGKIMAEEDDVIDLKPEGTAAGPGFYAYGRGRLLGESSSFTDALVLAYAAYGTVTDEDGRVIWNRVNRSNARTIRDMDAKAPALAAGLQDFSGTKRTEDGGLLLDCRGLTVAQLLYFIDHGNPVAAYTGGGGYLFISGFDQYNISLFNPSTGETSKMGLNDSEAYFQALGSDFVCYIKMK